MMARITRSDRCTTGSPAAATSLPSTTTKTCPLCQSMETAASGESSVLAPAALARSRDDAGG